MKGTTNSTVLPWIIPGFTVIENVVVDDHPTYRDLRGHPLIRDIDPILDRDRYTNRRASHLRGNGVAHDAPSTRQGATTFVLKVATAPSANDTEDSFFWFGKSLGLTVADEHETLSFALDNRGQAALKHLGNGMTVGILGTDIVVPRESGIIHRVGLRVGAEGFDLIEQSFKLEWSPDNQRTIWRATLYVAIPP